MNKNKIVISFFFLILIATKLFAQSNNVYNITIRDESGAEIGQYFDIQIDSISITSDTTLNFQMIPNLGIQDSTLQIRYTSFLEMLKRNTAKELEAAIEKEAVIGLFDTIHRNWGDHIDIYISDEYLGTDDLVRSTIAELNTGLGFNYFREIQNPVSNGWNFDYSNVDWRKERKLETSVQFDGQGKPEKATFKVQGVFYNESQNKKAINDFYYRLRDKIAELLLFNKSYDKKLIGTGEFDEYYFKISKFSNEFFNILKTIISLHYGRDFNNDKNEINKSPIANAGLDIECVTGQIMNLDGNGSLDLDGQIVTYLWHQMFETKTGSEFMTSNRAEISDSLSPIITFTPQYPGNYRFELSVRDNEGIINNDYVNVKVFQNNNQINIKGINTWAYYNSSEFDYYIPDKVDEFVNEDHAEWIEFAPYWWMETKYSNEVHPLEEYYPGAPGFTIPDSTLIKLINIFHNKGLKVLLRPTLEFYNWVEWRGGLEPTDWDLWFLSYENFITHYAAISEQTSIELFSIGNELKNSNGFTEKWNDIIVKVRNIYSGDLTYSDSELIYGTSLIEFWDKLDIISTGFYPPITGKGDYWNTGFQAMIDPPFQIFIQSLENWINTFLLPVYQSYQKPVLIVEAGCSNTEGANILPWYFDFTGKTIDNREQADYYEALFQVISNKSWISGVFIFVYDLKLDYNFVYSDWPFAHNPKLKPAREVVRFWYKD